MVFATAKFLPSLTVCALRNHLAGSMPLPLHIGSSLTAHWPATAWTFSNDLGELRQKIGEDREVEVEVGRRGRGYLDPEFQRINMGFGLFLDAFILGKIPSANPEALPSAYLAQSDIMDNTVLIEDVPALEHFTAGPKGELYRRTQWIGPSQSFTPFHRDPYIGIYTQVLGEKTFHVLPPSASPLLEPSSDPRHANTSTIPLPVSHIFAPAPSHTEDLDIPPRILDRCKDNLTKAAQLEGASEVRLKEGESVLVPGGWWHSAEGGPGPGVGVGAWFR